MPTRSPLPKHFSAPAHGRLQALDQHQEKIFASGALGAGVSLFVSGHKLVAPVNGRAEPMLNGLYWQLTEADGSRLILAFCSPLSFNLHTDAGISPKFGSACNVSVGDELADIQLPKLKQALGHQQMACIWPDRITEELLWQRHTVRANETPFVTLIDAPSIDQ